MPCHPLRLYLHSEQEPDRPVTREGGSCDAGGPGAALQQAERKTRTSGTKISVRGEGATGLGQQEGLCALESPSFNHQPPPFLAGSS